MTIPFRQIHLDFHTHEFIEGMGGYQIEEVQS